MKNLLRLSAAVVLVSYGVAGFSLPVLASVLSGQSSSEVQSTAVAKTWIAFSRGLGSVFGTAGTLNYIYVMVDNNGSTGYFHSILRECSVANCGSGTVNEYEPRSGPSTDKAVSMSAFGTKASVKFDFTTRCGPTNCGGSGWSSGGVTINPSYYYYLYVGGSSTNNTHLEDRTFRFYGTSTYTYDAYGNRFGCSYPAGTCGGGMETPWYLVTDSAATYAEGSQFGFSVPSSSSTGLDFSGARGFCAPVANQVASPSFAYGVPYGLVYGLCYVPSFLVIPSKDSVTSFWDSAGVVRSKIPYSYFVEVQNLWTTASSTSLSYPVIHVPVAVFGASASIPVVSSASFTKWVSSGTLSTLRSLTTAVIFVSLAFYLWRRVRHMFRNR